MSDSATTPSAKPTATEFAAFKEILRREYRAQAADQVLQAKIAKIVLGKDLPFCFEGSDLPKNWGVFYRPVIHGPTCSTLGFILGDVGHALANSTTFMVTPTHIKKLFRITGAAVACFIAEGHALTLRRDQYIHDDRGARALDQLSHALAMQEWHARNRRPSHNP